MHSSIGKAPFEILYGKPLLPPILRTKENIFSADEFVRDLDIAYQQVRQSITRSQQKQKAAQQINIDVISNLMKINGYYFDLKKLAYGI